MTRRIYNLRKKNKLSIASSGGSAPEPEPFEITTQAANLKKYYNADRESYSNNDLIPTINDWSGNNRHLTQSNDSLKCTYKVGVLGGRAVYEFTGAQLYNAIGGKGDDDFLHQGASTLIMLINSGVDNASNIVFDSIGTSPSNVGRKIDFNIIGSGNNGSFRNRIGNGSGTLYMDLTLPRAASSSGNVEATPKDQWHLIVQIIDPSLSDDNYKCYVNNFVRGYKTATGSLSGSTSTNLPIWFAQSGGALGSRFTGKLAFLAAWDTALTFDDIEEVIGYNLSVEV